MAATASDFFGAAASAVGNVAEAASAWPLHLRGQDGVLAAHTTLGAVVAGRSGVDAGDYIATLDLPTGTQLTHEVQIAPDGNIDLRMLLSGVLARLGRDSSGAVPLPHSSSSSLGHIAAAIEKVQEELLPNLKNVPPQASGVPSIPPDASGVIGALLRAKAGSLLSGLAPSVGALIGIRGMGVSEAPRPGWRIEVWRGTAIGRGLIAQAGQTPALNSPNGEVRFRADAVHRPTTICVARGDGDEPVNLIVPPGTTVTISVERSVEIETGDSTVDEILRLRSSGRVIGLAAATAGVDVGLVRRCLDRPSAALAAAYRLLLAGSPDVDEALAILEPLADIADTLVLRAEYAARAGRHDKAFPLFLQACGLDLPMFSAGLGFVTDRMRRYSDLGRAVDGDSAAELRASGLPDTAPIDARRALTAVQPFGLRCDFASPLVRYRGLIRLAAAGPEAVLGQTPREKAP